MNIGERIRHLRKNLLNFTADRFGKSIGIQKSAISKIERGENGVTDQVIKSICREFGVREEWLRSGDGDPFGPQTLNQEIQAFINKIMAAEDDDFRKQFIALLSRLDESEWPVLEKITTGLTKKD